MRITSYCILPLLIVTMSAASYGVPATDTLDVYVIDACGGKAMIVATPEGETMLIDAGHPRQDNRDTKRVIETAKSLGISRFDYIVATHYDSDHSGNVASVDAIIPGRTFVDHGKPLAELANRSNRDYDSYINAIGARKRISVKPGDTIPVKGLRITVVTSGGKAITRPLTQTAMPNEFAETTKPMSQLDHNIGSIGLLYEFGKFRMLDLADLLVSVEYKLLCPNNLLGNVDLFMVGHHGFKLSNSKFLIHAIAPKVSVMNNGPRKGGEAEVFELLKSSPGMQDIWQLHYAFNAGEQMNSPEQFIANLEQEQLCQGKLIKISAKKDGSFAIINTRNNFSKTY